MVAGRAGLGARLDQDAARPVTNVRLAIGHQEAIAAPRSSRSNNQPTRPELGSQRPPQQLVASNRGLEQKARCLACEERRDG